MRSAESLFPFAFKASIARNLHPYIHTTLRNRLGVYSQKKVCEIKTIYYQKQHINDKGSTFLKFGSQQWAINVSLLIKFKI